MTESRVSKKEILYRISAVSLLIRRRERDSIKASHIKSKQNMSDGNKYIA